MECKNCNDNLRTDYSFCPSCGAKVIRNRLTVRNLWHDIFERYFNLDNTFINTFLHLFTKPEVVIDGYISGIRRKYLNPTSYLAIAITLSGFLVFLLTKNIDQIDMDVFNNGVNATQGSKKIMDFTMDYQALLFILYIPMMAIAGWLVFENKKYNFAERSVVFMYTLAHYSIFTFLPSVILISIIPGEYMSASLIVLAAMYLYCAYVIKRITKLKGLDYIARVILFFILFTVQYFALIFLIPIILILTGSISLKDFAPVK
ncbi:hypothetical protein GGR42_003055 [Saonia flava]|uniref:DUF3667 domain-containing protein n=1 Tax=Saonia flava TaxID=523696 RepID=A0A846R5A7_9FLAO|nr:DUF3667 domain-containing protein [Saonia flava]NJB72564.1 hypothetical protein [Saonia flava]